MTETLAAPAVVKRHKIVLCGFFGRGNAGDEAFLHTQYELLKDEFDIVIAVEDGGGLHPDFMSWDPYRTSEVWSHSEFARVFGSSDIVGVNVGGGSLPFGYGAPFMLSAIDAGKCATLTGVDLAINTKRKGGGDFRRGFFDFLDLVAVRFKSHYANLKRNGVPVLRGADWAVGLKPRDSFQNIDVLITIRGFGGATQSHLDTYRGIAWFYEQQGRNVKYLPFALEDEVVLDQMEIPADRRESHWHDPRTVLSVVAGANLVVSVGRLHALIFAMNQGVPTFAVDPGIIQDGKHVINNKNRHFCKEFGLTFFETTQGFLDTPPVFEDGRDYGFSESYRKQYDRMADRIYGTFAKASTEVVADQDV